jgi:hypothetical protein
MSKLAMVHSEEIEDADLIIMLEIYRQFPSMRELANMIGKSLGIAQFRVKWMQDNEYIKVPEKRGWRNLQLTNKGKETLEKYGLTRKNN